MSGRTWAIADPHFGHANICKFVDQNGDKIRPWDDVGLMDKALIYNWNAVVEEADRVYVLGDVAMNRRCLSILHHLKGRKVLVKGNHDIFKLNDYLPFFDDIRACVVGKTHEGHKYILTHIPIHPDSLGRFDINIHGHIHERTIADHRYVCVSVEQTDYTPIQLHEAIARSRPGSVSRCVE